MNNPHKALPRRLIFELVVAGILLIVAANYQTLVDQYWLIYYHPSPQMAQIENEIGLTSQAKAVFASARPQIDSKADFNRDCATTPDELELGCFFHGRIYVLQIDNPSLAPEMEVVTAHELLHAEWARFSSGEQAMLTSELEAEYKVVATSDLAQRMQGYAKSEPGQRDNELHSILGTEFANLSSPLKSHYDQYFTDRPAIAQAHAEYENVFNSRRAELAQELDQINAEKARLNRLDTEMQSDRDNGQISLYNSLVPEQNRLVTEVNSQINDYQQGVNEYNELSDSLSSQPITQTAQSQ
jgi:Skp family chaperone for outer membrane proteins